MRVDMIKQQIMAAVAYPLIVFPLAIVWHLGLFEGRYMEFGYFDGEPNIVVGLASMVVQGVVLAAIYPLFLLGRVGLALAFKFAAVLGLFFWTSHVLALVAKQNVPQAGTFILMETIYLCLQFGLFALALGVIFRGGGQASVTPA